MAAWIFKALQEKAKPLQHFLLAFTPGIIPARIFHCQQREGWTRKAERACGGAATKPKFPGLSQVLAAPRSSHPSIDILLVVWILSVCSAKSTWWPVRSRCSLELNLLGKALWDAQEWAQPNHSFPVLLSSGIYFLHKFRRLLNPPQLPNV